MRPDQFNSWLTVDAKGLYCQPGGFHIDPYAGAKRAIDHPWPFRPCAARPRARARDARHARHHGAAARDRRRAAAPRRRPMARRIAVGDVAVTLVPAGHVLGSAQVVIEYRGARAVVSGDYKRRADPTCPAFELVPCDLFVTEATFALAGVPARRCRARGRRSCSSRAASFPSARMSSASTGSANASG